MTPELTVDLVVGIAPYVTIILIFLVLVTLILIYRKSIVKLNLPSLLNRASLKIGAAELSLVAEKASSPMTIGIDTTHEITGANYDLIEEVNWEQPSAILMLGYNIRTLRDIVVHYASVPSEDEKTLKQVQEMISQYLELIRTGLDLLNLSGYAQVLYNSKLEPLKTALPNYVRTNNSWKEPDELLEYVLFLLRLKAQQLSDAKKISDKSRLISADAKK